MFTNHTHTQQDLALHNPQGLICSKIEPTRLVDIALKSIDLASYRYIRQAGYSSSVDWQTNLGEGKIQNELVGG